MPESLNAVLLDATLEVAVPLWFERFTLYGGPDDNDWEWAREFAWVLGSEGDIILYKSEKKGQTAQRFNNLARALAIMAHAPGGVHFLGRHWQRETT